MASTALDASAQTNIIMERGEKTDLVSEILDAHGIPFFINSTWDENMVLTNTFIIYAPKSAVMSIAPFARKSLLGISVIN